MHHTSDHSTAKYSTQLAVRGSRDLVLEDKFDPMPNGGGPSI